jgi:hypothetical protein
LLAKTTFNEEEPMKKSLLIQALLAVAYASNAQAAIARPTLTPVMKSCTCCKQSVSAFDVRHEQECRHLAELKGEAVGDEEDMP